MNIGSVRAADLNYHTRSDASKLMYCMHHWAESTTRVSERNVCKYYTSSLHGLQNITTWSAFVDGTSSSTLKELVISGANNEESLRSGLQKCLTSLHFIAAAEELSFFLLSKLPGLVELGKCHGVQEFFSPKHNKKNCYTNHTNCYAIQFSCRRNCYAKFWQ